MSKVLAYNFTRIKRFEQYPLVGILKAKNPLQFNGRDLKKLTYAFGFQASLSDTVRLKINCAEVESLSTQK